MPSNWLEHAALGMYNKYASELAQNLVNAGLGGTVIRLGHEANSGIYADSVPNTADGPAEWRDAFANIVTTMRAVPGAHFQFDWTVNYETYGTRGISLSSFYPGNQYVDIIGLDAYDENTDARSNRFQFELNRPGGISAVYAFAASHGKPMSMPEWGMLPAGGPMRDGGDDPDYIQGIGQFVATHNVVYTGYWYAHQDTIRLLECSVLGLRYLRQFFGIEGVARSSSKVATDVRPRWRSASTRFR